ncbi:6-bladed beta-propeller [Aestuariivivens sediminis]|uniref:6-bladed beta-propeller n=1 Tax=Aestuariivivens sediminis TaxID=2913557 RepID=UPI001F59231E|nr:6-bladed beta-propeller [Aestuariivivens sediminis]
MAPNSKAEAEPFRMFYPRPPDTARLQFLTKFDSSLDFGKKRSSFMSKIVGEEAPLSIGKPYGVEIKNSKIFVCDLAGRIDVIDLVAENIRHFTPMGQGKLLAPVNMAIDDQDNMFIVDIRAKVIKTFNKNGSFTGAIGGDELVKPSDVDLMNNKLYVCDTDNNRINIYDKNSGAHLSYIPKAEPKTEEWLFKPTNICVTDSEIHVSDTGANCVKTYTLDGQYVRKTGSYGTKVGQFARTKGISVDKENNLYVVDGAYQNVQIFNDKGETLMAFGAMKGLIGGMILPTSITVDYDNMDYFLKYVDPKFNLKYIILVANQYGNKINIYGRIVPK